MQQRLPDPPAMTGPFETEREARELPAVRAVYDAFSRDPGPGKMIPHCRAILDEACSAAGAGAGDYDDRILAWLAGWGPETCAVIAGLIHRAHLAGLAVNAAALDERPVTLARDRAAIVARALADAEKYRMREAGQWCADCQASPAEACETHLDDLDAAQAYGELARRLGEAARCVSAGARCRAGPATR